MIWEVLITLEGSPGMIQRIADAVDLAVPGAVGWQDDAAASSRPGRIILKGMANEPSGEDHSVAA